MKSFIRAAVMICAALANFSALAQPADNALLIDTRSPAEYQGGHIEGAVLIPYDAIESGIVKLSPAKDAPIYLYCGSGGRAEIARKRLEHRGYTQVTNLGGMAQAEAFLGKGAAQP
ncbi:MAG: rhodanese-like domain-containing protein [Halioglobus sp.]